MSRRSVLPSKRITSAPARLLALASSRVAADTDHREHPATVGQ